MTKHKIVLAAVLTKSRSLLHFFLNSILLLWLEVREDYQL